MKLMVACVAAAAVVLSGCSAAPTQPVANNAEPDATAVAEAVRLAQALYANAQKHHFDLSKGPCLSDTLMNDWVLDIAHNPRDPNIDDDPANQCEAFRENRAHHFVELDIDGTLIRAL